MQPVTVGSLEFGTGIPKICVPLMGSSLPALLKEIESLCDVQPDLVEWRIDAATDRAEDVSAWLPALRNACPYPLLCTFRTQKEGGLKPLDDAGYTAIVRAVIQSGCADLVDIELFSGETVSEQIREAHAAGVKVVASNHDFQKTPPKEELVRRFCKMHELGADLPKIAVMPQNTEDVLTLLEATAEASKRFGPVISMSMGALGMVSRVSGETFGSCLTFGAAGQASAPGQLPVHKLREILLALHG